MTDLDQARVDKGVAYVHGQIDKMVGRKRMDEGTAAKLRGLVSGSVDKSVFADADIVIEAVFENLDLKKQVWAELVDAGSEQRDEFVLISKLGVAQAAAAEQLIAELASRQPGGVSSPVKPVAAACSRPKAATVDTQVESTSMMSGGEPPRAAAVNLSR